MLADDRPRRRGPIGTRQVRMLHCPDCGSALPWRIFDVRLVQGNTMRNVGNAPTLVVWVISLVLFIVALLAQFNVVSGIPATVALWSWIVGYALLLVACRVRGL